MKKHQMVFCILMILVTGGFAADLDYPDSYRTLQLPEYENATLTGLSRETGSLHDGIKLTLLTQDNDSTLRSYYEAEMHARGWQLQETIAVAKMRAAGMLEKLPFAAVFSKGDMRYQISTNQRGNGTEVHINLVED